ncbi:MAG: pyruvate kinase [Saprospirales bacterium]|nr:MAG: pyruvate kinase [Saprospirales bacterium]
MEREIIEQTDITSHQNTKIVATIGPASNSYEKLLELVKAGVDTFRLNFSHGVHEEHGKVIKFIQQINEEYKVHIGILADLSGPKLRIGSVADETYLEEGSEFSLVNTPCTGDEKRAYLNYMDFPKDVVPGEKVLIDDGKIVLEVIDTNQLNEVKMVVRFGGRLSSNKGVNLPDTKTTFPSLTEKDLHDLKYILTQPVNWIALSFVRSHKDILALRKKLDKAGHFAKIIAKIEKPEAVKNIDKIIKHSNGIMVARGDLGVEVPIEKLPSIQKMIIRKCIQRARTVIVATQMMESMITAPSPTRAEVTDVANAVLDGTDAVMLSAETAMGRHPARVVRAMDKIIEETEKHYKDHPQKRPKASPHSSTFYSDVICFNAAKTAEDINAAAIIGMTVSGYTAFKISSYRPNNKIYIFSEERHVLATLNLVWGVRCYFYDKYTTTDETIEDVQEILKKNRRIKSGDVIVNTGSMPIHKKLRTNMLKITVVD